jgi:hypothetical protein
VVDGPVVPLKDDAGLLAEVLMGAEPPAFVALYPKVQALATQALTVLEAELARKLSGQLFAGFLPSKVSLETRRFKPRYDTAKLFEQLRTRGVRPETLERYRVHLATPMDCVVTTVLINREIALMGMPGEPFVEFGLDFRSRSPAPASYLAGYCNGYHGYFPTIRAAVEGATERRGLPPASRSARAKQWSIWPSSASSRCKVCSRASPETAEPFSRASGTSAGRWYIIMHNTVHLYTLMG